jgi:hypothetical protein
MQESIVQLGNWFKETAVNIRVIDRDVSAICMQSQIDSRPIQAKRSGRFHVARKDGDFFLKFADHRTVAPEP